MSARGVATVTYGADRVVARWSDAPGASPDPTLRPRLAAFLAEETRGAVALAPDGVATGPAAHLGDAAEVLALFLRAEGFAAAIEVAPGVRLRHPACGVAHDPAAWLARPPLRQADLRPGGYIETRACDCRSHITFASLRAEAPATEAP